MPCVGSFIINTKHSDSLNMLQEWWNYNLTSRNFNDFMEQEALLYLLGGYSLNYPSRYSCVNTLFTSSSVVLLKEQQFISIYQSINDLWFIHIPTNLRHHYGDLFFNYQLRELDLFSNNKLVNSIDYIINDRKIINNIDILKVGEEMALYCNIICDGSIFEISDDKKEEINNIDMNEIFSLKFSTIQLQFHGLLYSLFLNDDDDDDNNNSDNYHNILNNLWYSYNGYRYQIYTYEILEKLKFDKTFIIKSNYLEYFGNPNELIEEPLTDEIINEIIDNLNYISKNFNKIDNLDNNDVLINQI